MTRARIMVAEGVAAAVAQRPGAVVVGRDPMVAVWREPEQPPAARWRAQAIRRFARNGDGTVAVWWGVELGARTRRAAVEAARVEGAP